MRACAPPPAESAPHALVCIRVTEVILSAMRGANTGLGEWGGMNAVAVCAIGGMVQYGWA